MDELEAWLRLWHTPKVGPKTFHFILKRFPDLREIFDTTLDALIDRGIPSHIGKSIIDGHTTDYGIDLEWAQSSDAHHILRCTDHDYPDILQQISQPPPLLYICGDVRPWQYQVSVAMVGSRKASSYAFKVAFEIAEQLANCGFTIVSGLARGIDRQAHAGALAAKYPSTIAVLGNGLDRIYPAEHGSLARQIASNGLLISEFPPKVAPLPQHFPRRNRIISGLSLGTLVIEAAQSSGSLITARYAVEQNREVFAIPGPINNPQNQGCHSLIQQGAKLVTKVEDIIAELAPMIELKPCDPFSASSKKPQSNNPQQQTLLDFIDYTPTPVDVIIEKSGLTPERVSSMLMELEISGEVAADAFGQYCRV